MMKTPQNPEERIRKASPPVVTFAVAVIILDILLIQLLKAGWFDPKTFSIWIAPPLEEAIKGGFASLLGIIYLILYARGRISGSKTLAWAILAGILSGAAFALSESLGQGESLLALGTGLYLHPIWATGVSIGCWSLILEGDWRLLAGVFPVAAAGHSSWNYFVHEPTNLTTVLAVLLIAVILIFIFWRHYRDLLSKS